MKFIKFNFSAENLASTFELRYQLFENSFVEKWLPLFKQAVKNSSGFREKLFFGSIFESESALILEINRALEKINSFNPSKFSFTHWARSGMSHQHLMALHSEFELAEKLELFRIEADKEIRSELLKVNELIHRYQATLESGKDFHINCIFNEPKTYSFDREDLSFFSPHYYDGWLYLDYATTGVTIFDAYRFKTQQRPVPQTTYQAGCKLLFDGNRVRTEEELKLIKDWMKKKWDLDPSDPWNTLGYIPLGKLVSPSSRELVEEGLKTHHSSFEVEVLD